MARQIRILDSAKAELKEIREYIKRDFGDAVWNTVRAQYSSAFESINASPEAGNVIDELKETGISNVKYMLVRQTRVVYEFDDHMVLIHMFISTRRDFRTHLLHRLLSQ